MIHEGEESGDGEHSMDLNSDEVLTQFDDINSLGLTSESKTFESRFCPFSEPIPSSSSIPPRTPFGVAEVGVVAINFCRTSLILS